MGFLTSLFGGEAGTSWWGAGFALIIVLVLIVAGLWALKLLFNASGTVARGRQRRLAVIDTLSVDGKRNLVLVRRDDVEHLLVIGGTHDVVVETGIAVESAAAPQRSARQQPSKPHTPERRQAASASRLGLSGLLRRYNDTSGEVVEPTVATPLATPGGRSHAPAHADAARTAPTLRHTGLLRPASNDDEFDGDLAAVEETEISVPEPSDSAMNVAGQPDAEAMASIEERATADDVGTEGDEHAGPHGDAPEVEPEKQH